VTGSELRSTLGFDDFMNCYIQKVLGTAVSLYLVSINSRYPEKFIPSKVLKNNLTTQGYRVGLEGLEKFKLTPPVELSSFSGNLLPNSYIVVRDLGGEGILSNRVLSTKSKLKTTSAIPSTGIDITDINNTIGV